MKIGAQQAEDENRREADKEGHSDAEHHQHTARDDGRARRTYAGKPSGLGQLAFEIVVIGGIDAGKCRHHGLGCGEVLVDFAADDGLCFLHQAFCADVAVSRHDLGNAVCQGFGHKAYSEAAAACRAECDGDDEIGFEHIEDKAFQAFVRFADGNQVALNHDPDCKQAEDDCQGEGQVLRKDVLGEVGDTRVKVVADTGKEEKIGHGAQEKVQ